MNDKENINKRLSMKMPPERCDIDVRPSGDIKYLVDPKRYVK